MVAHLLSRRKPWLRDSWTRKMLCGVQELQYWLEYLLRKNFYLCQNLLVRDARYNTDHYLILGFLHRAAVTDNY